MALNLYQNLTNFKSEIGASGTTNDADMLRILEQSSRWIDDYCHRHFYTETATRYFDGLGIKDTAWVDDIISLTSATQDADDDATYSETVTENTDFWLIPFNVWPKIGLEHTTNPTTTLDCRRRVLKLTGIFGYGDGTSDPWEALSPAGTVATTSGTTLTVSDSAVLDIGQTIKLGTEQMFVSDSSSGSATVKRGVNGTTAAAQSSAAIYTAKYPEPITAACQILARFAWLERKQGDIQIFRVGEHSEQKMTTDQRIKGIERLIGAYRRYF